MNLNFAKSLFLRHYNGFSMCELCPASRDAGDVHFVYNNFGRFAVEAPAQLEAAARERGRNAPAKALVVDAEARVEDGLYAPGLVEEVTRVNVAVMSGHVLVGCCVVNA